ncbi:MAG: hypothetical protein WCL23_01225 [Candidatus Moraniibacteriota bacterium]
METNTHAQNLISDNSPIVPLSAMGGSDDVPEVPDSAVTGTGQGNGNEHIRFGGPSAKPISQSEDEATAASEDVFDTFGNSIKTDDDSSVERFV